MMLSSPLVGRLGIEAQRVLACSLDLLVQILRQWLDITVEIATAQSEDQNSERESRWLTLGLRALRLAQVANGLLEEALEPAEPPDPWPDLELAPAGDEFHVDAGSLAAFARSMSGPDEDKARELSWAFTDVSEITIKLTRVLLPRLRTPPANNTAHSPSDSLLLFETSLELLHLIDHLEKDILAEYV
jgi:hypothetical protein